MPKAQSNTPPQSEEQRATSTPAMQVAQTTVNLRIPRFWKENPAVWFAQLEAQFENFNIVTERSKYFAVLPELDPELLTQVSDIVLERPDDAYTRIKQRLIDHFSISEEKRIKRLLNEMPIGDKKPSSLLREMRNLANGGVNDEFLRTMWLQRLSSQTQAILATSTETLDNLAAMADKIGDISSASTGNISAIQERTEIIELRQQIAALTTAIQQLQTTRNRESRSSSRKRQQRFRSSSEQVCYYHKKFGSNARCCRQPCSYNCTSSENSQGGR